MQQTHNFRLAACALALAALGLASTAYAAPMTKAEYKAGIAAAGEQYSADKAACGSFAANARDICMAQAKGKENVAKADVEDRLKLTRKSAYQLAVAKAEADYKVAIERCDDKAGNEKDVCVKEAKSVRVAAKADASTRQKTGDANQDARDTSNAARAKADGKNAATSQDAAATKRDADYAVAREKCDAFASDAKENCIKDAKARFGKS